MMFRMLIFITVLVLSSCDRQMLDESDKEYLCQLTNSENIYVKESSGGLNIMIHGSSMNESEDRVYFYPIIVHEVFLRTKQARNSFELDGTNLVTFVNDDDIYEYEISTKDLLKLDATVENLYTILEKLNKKEDFSKHIDNGIEWSEFSGLIEGIKREIYFYYGYETGIYGVDISTYDICFYVKIINNKKRRNFKFCFDKRNEKLRNYYPLENSY